MASVGVELDLRVDPMAGSSITPSASPIYVSQTTAMSGTHHAGIHLAAAADVTNTMKTRPRHTLLNIAGQNKTGCSSPPLSPTTTPTTYSFGPLSPHSFNSSVQTPPATVASFTHSREPSLDSGGAMSAQASPRDPPKGRTQHKRSASSLDLCLRFRHQRAGSRDWDNLTQKMSRMLAVQSPPQGFEPLEECVDEDLLKYRQETPPTAKPPVDAVSIQDPTTGEPSKTMPPPVSDGPADTQLEDDAILPSSDDDRDAEDLVTADNKNTGGEADRIASAILAGEFGLQLGSTAPPEDIVESVRQCLAEISLSLRRARGMGALATAAGDIPMSQAASGSASSSPGPVPLESSSSRGKSQVTGRKRFAQDDEGQEDDMEEDGGGGRGNGEGGDVSGYSDAGHRKKPKLEQYPCPFRKRSPRRFNCREWEYCARAPFKSMTELKKHIIKYHQQQQFTYKCIRCHAGFTKVDDLENHMRADIASMCSVRPGPPPSLEDDDRITAAVGSQLRSRANHYDWAALWRTLFPRDASVPEPDFEPIIELHEVDHEFQSSLVDFRLQLHSTLDMVLSGWKPPRNAAQLRHIVDGTLENLFQDFVATTFRNARDKVASEWPVRPQPEVNNSPSPAAATGAPSPLSFSANTQAAPAALPTRAPPAAPIHPKPRAILPHPIPPPAPSSSSGASVRYSFVSNSSAGTTVSRSNSSRLRDSITAESVTSMSTSSESYSQQQFPPRTAGRQFVLATRQQQRQQPPLLELRKPSVMPAVRSSSPLPLHLLNDFVRFGNGNANNNPRDSGIDMEMLQTMDMMMMEGAEKDMNTMPLDAAPAAVAGQLGDEDDFSRYLDLGQFQLPLGEDGAEGTTH